jgi:arylsulfatase A-like enzyme
MYTRMMLALILLAGACADRDTGPPLIRWVDPARIEAVETEHPELLRGNRYATLEDNPFVSLNGGSDWHSYAPEPGRAGGRESASTNRGAAQGGSILRIEARRGQAGIIPIGPVGQPRRILVRSKGDFSEGSGLRIRVVDLDVHQALPASLTAETIEGIVKAHGEEPRLLSRDAGGSSASLLFFITPETRALLFLIEAGEERAAELEWIRVDFLNAKELWLLSRIERGIAHPAVARNPMLGGTIRPSLMLPPRSAITLKPMKIPEAGMFGCSLGKIGIITQPVEVRLTGNTPEGDSHELFTRRIEPGLEGWEELELDLARFSGRTMTFKLHCDWAGDEPAIDNPPIVLCGAPILYSGKPAPASRGPNLVLISLDTLRADRLGCYGYPRPVSPVIDEFAKGAYLFKNAYSHSAYTNVSHASLFSSLYPSAHGLLGRSYMMAEGAPVLAQILADQGLSTASFNGGGMMSHEFGFDLGFDLCCEVDPLGERFRDGYPVNITRNEDGSRGSMSRLMSWIDSMKDRRFFLYVHTFMVHDYMPPMDLAAQFHDVARDGMKTRKEVIDQTMMAHYQVHGWTEKDHRFFNNMYDASIRAADIMVGEIIERLETLGVHDDTIIAITADHGEEFEEHGGINHCFTVYEELIRVPFILRVPGRDGGVAIATRIGQVDFLPSILELMELESPGPVQGRSFVPLMQGLEEQDRLVIAEVDLPKLSRRMCILEDRWKYIEGDTSEAVYYPAPAPFELFDLVEDPGEQRNAFELFPDDAETLRKRMHEMKKSAERMHETLGGRESSDSALEAHEKWLEELGYF